MKLYQFLLAGLLVTSPCLPAATTTTTTKPGFKELATKMAVNVAWTLGPALIVGIISYRRSMSLSDRDYHNYLNPLSGDKKELLGRKSGLDVYIALSNAEYPYNDFNDLQQIKSYEAQQEAFTNARITMAIIGLYRFIQEWRAGRTASAEKVA